MKYAAFVRKPYTEWKSVGLLNESFFEKRKEYLIKQYKKGGYTYNTYVYPNGEKEEIKFILTLLED